jgi:hypothetical protein
MKTEELVGLFVTGSLKNGSTFFGEVLETDAEYLYISGEPANPPKRTKIVRISEIAEIVSEPMRRDL